MKWCLLMLMVFMSSCALNGWKASPGKDEQEKRYNEIKGYHLSGRHVILGILIDDYLKKYPSSKSDEELRFLKARAELKGRDVVGGLEATDSFLEKYPESKYKEELTELRTSAEEKYNTFEKHFVFNLHVGRAMGTNGENDVSRMSAIGLSYNFQEKMAFGFDLEKIRFKGKDSQFDSINSTKNDKEFYMAFYTPTFSYRHFLNDKYNLIYKAGLGFGMNSMPERYEDDGSNGRSSFAFNQKLILNYCYLNRDKVKCWDGDNVSLGVFHYQFTNGGFGNEDLDGKSVWGLMLGISG